MGEPGLCMCGGRIVFDFVLKGQNFLPEQIQGAKDKALLKKEVSARGARHAVAVLMSAKTDLEDCANTFIDVAKNSSMTCQTVVVGEWMTYRAAQYWLIQFTRLGHRRYPMSSLDLRPGLPRSPNPVDFISEPFARYFPSFPPSALRCHWGVIVRRVEWVLQ